MTLHHQIVGDHGPLVVFCHGLFGQGKNFGMISRKLTDAYRVAQVDLPHHGRSPWDGPISYDGMSGVVAAHIADAYAQDTPVILVGHSLGGKVAMRIALTQPELVRALIVEDISPRATNKAAYFQPIFEALTELDLDELDSRQRASELLAPKIADPTVRAFLLQNLHYDHRERRWYWQMNLQGLAASVDEINAWTDVPGRSYDGPVAWIGGSQSDYITHDAAAHMRELFPRVRRVTIKGAGHWVHSEQPDAFASAVRVFCDAVTGVTGSLRS